MPIEIRGVDDEEARETLRRQLERSSFSGVRVPLDDDCAPVWDDLTDLPDFDRELKRGGVQMVWARVCMTPLSFVRLQAAASEAALGDRGQGEMARAEQFLREPLMGDAPRLREMVSILESGARDLPIPFIELDREGRIRGFQEGRTRGMAAFYADIDQMPALVFLNTRREDGKSRLDPPSEFTVEAVLDREAPEFGGSPHPPFADEQKARRVTQPEAGDEWPGTWAPHEPEFAFVPTWRNAGGQEVRLTERREGEPVAETSTGEVFRGLTLPEMHDVIWDFMEDNPGGGNPGNGGGLDDMRDEIRRRMGEADNTIWIEAVIGQQQPIRPGDFDEVSDFIEEQAGLWAESMTQRPDIDRVFCVTGEDRPEPRQPFTVVAANRVHCFIGFDTDEMTTRQVDGLRKDIRRRFRGEDIDQDEPPGVASFRDFEEVNVVSEDVIAAVDPGLAGPPIEDVEFID